MYIEAILYLFKKTPVQIPKPLNQHGNVYRYYIILEVIGT